MFSIFIRGKGEPVKGTAALVTLEYDYITLVISEYDYSGMLMFSLCLYERKTTTITTTKGQGPFLRA